MGWAQRSRRKLPAGTVCYLCGKPIDPTTERWDRDHVPPVRIFPSSVREAYNPQLAWLPTHVECNRRWRLDEEYFVVSFAGHVDSPIAKEVMKDLRDAAQKGHGVGLLREVISRLGRVVGANGEVLYSYDTARVHGFLWKLARGLYAGELDVVLPAIPPQGIELVSPRNVPTELEQIRWFPRVRNTEPMGRYGGVFDYKWLCWKDGNLRGHAFAMLFWDGLLAAMLFHDPTCSCGSCEDWKQGSTADQRTTGTVLGDNRRDANGDAKP